MLHGNSTLPLSIHNTLCFNSCIIIIIIVFLLLNLIEMTSESQRPLSKVHLAEMLPLTLVHIIGSITRLSLLSFGLLPSELSSQTLPFFLHFFTNTCTCCKYTNLYSSLQASVRVVFSSYLPLNSPRLVTISWRALFLRSLLK